MAAYSHTYVHSLAVDSSFSKVEVLEWKHLGEHLHVTHFRHVPSPSVFNFLQLLLLNFWGFIAMFKGIAPPSLSISGHLIEIMRMKSWLTCWKEQVDTVNCLSNIWIKKSRSVGTNCCGVSALVLQLWLLSRFSCLAQMLDPDSYYQNGHELMKEKLIASSLVLQDKGFIAMSKDSVTPSPMTQNNCSVSTRTLIRNSFTTGSDQRGQFRDPRCGVERAKRGAFGLRTYDLKLGEPPTSQVWQRRTTPPWQCLPDAPFVGEWSKAAIREYRANPQYRKTRRAKGLGTPACAQCACMREQEPKVLGTETLDLKILWFQLITLFCILNKMWFSGATARPPGQVACVQAYHPWSGYGAHAHAISASS